MSKTQAPVPVVEPAKGGPAWFPTPQGLDGTGPVPGAPSARRDEAPPSVVSGLEEDLGEVDGVPSLNAVAGQFLGAIVPSWGSVAAGEVDISLRIEAVVLAASLTFSLKRRDKLELGGSFRLQAGAQAGLRRFRLSAGLYVQAAVTAQADTGQELMDLVSLALLPAVERRSDRLADRLFGRTSAFTERVVSGMALGDLDDPSDDDFVEASVEAGVYASVKTGGKAKGAKLPEGALDVGYRTSARLAKDDDGTLTTVTTNALVVRMAVEAGGLSWEAEYCDGQLELTAEGEPPSSGPKALQLYLAGTLASLANLVDLVTAQLQSGGPKTEAAAATVSAAWGLLRNKLSAVAAMSLSVPLPDAVSVLLGFELLLGAENRLAVRVAEVLEGAVELDGGIAGGSVEAKVEVGQEVLVVG